MRAKIDINEVETRTKIRAKYLRAIENEEWDLLPGEVYVKSFLRTYGEYLGLDTRQLIDDFRRRYERPPIMSCGRSRPLGRDASAAAAPAGRGPAVADDRRRPGHHRGRAVLRRQGNGPEHIDDRPRHPGQDHDQASPPQAPAPQGAPLPATSVKLQLLPTAPCTSAWSTGPARS